MGGKRGRWACFRHLRGRKYLTHWIGQRKIVFCDDMTWNAGLIYFWIFILLESPFLFWVQEDLTPGPSPIGRWVAVASSSL